MKRFLKFILRNWLPITCLVVFSYSFHLDLRNPDYDFMTSLEKSDPSWEIGLGFMCAGLTLMLIVGAFRVRKIPNKKYTRGIIIETEYKFIAGNRYAYIQYWVDDISYVFKSKHLDMNFHKGYERRIAYNAENPKQADLCPLISDYVVTVLLEFIGISFIILDLFVF